MIFAQWAFFLQSTDYFSSQHFWPVKISSNSTFWYWIWFVWNEESGAAKYQSLYASARYNLRNQMYHEHGLRRRELGSACNLRPSVRTKAIFRSNKIRHCWNARRNKCVRLLQFRWLLWFRLGIQFQWLNSDLLFHVLIWGSRYSMITFFTQNFIHIYSNIEINYRTVEIM